MILKIALFSYISFANISLDFNINSEGHKVHKTLKTKLNQEQTFKIPNSKKEVTIIASDDIPANIPLKYQESSVKFKIKVYENNKLISSPEVVTLYGKEASMTMSEKPGEMPTISLKVKARR